MFDIDRSVVTKHLQNVFADGELVENSTCANFAQVADNGKTYQYKFYSLPAIITVGYRAKSPRKPRGRTKQHLCADAGYSGEKSGETMRRYHYIPHICSRGEEKIAIKNGYKPRRWIVEVAHSWFNRFHKLPVRYEKTNSSFEALLHLAAVVIIYRKLAVI